MLCLFGVFRFADGILKDDIHGSIWPHYGNLSRWPGIVDITTQVFTAHSHKGSIRFTGGDAYFGYSGLSISIEKFGAMPADAFIFLFGARHISWGINESNQGDVEAVTKADESGAFVRGININRAGVV